MTPQLFWMVNLHYYGSKPSFYNGHNWVPGIYRYTIIRYIYIYHYIYIYIQSLILKKLDDSLPKKFLRGFTAQLGIKPGWIEAMGNQSSTLSGVAGC